MLMKIKNKYPREIWTSLPPIDFDKLVELIYIQIRIQKNKKHRKTKLFSIILIYCLDYLIRNNEIPSLSNIVDMFDSEFGPITYSKYKLLNCLKILHIGELIERPGKVYLMKNKIIYGTKNPKDHLLFLIKRIDIGYRDSLDPNTKKKEEIGVNSSDGMSICRYNKSERIGFT